MSWKRLLRAIQAAMTTLAVIAFACPTTYAADPNSAPPKKQMKLQAATRSAVRKPAPARRTPASFTPEMSFGEAIDILRNCTSPPLNIVVLWKQLGENADVYRETPIGIDGVTGLRVRQYLELLLLSLSGTGSAKLGYVVNGGVVTVGTVDALPAPKKVTRVYDISDLVAPPSRPMFGPMGYGVMGYGNMPYGNVGYGNMGYGGFYGGAYAGNRNAGYIGTTGQSGRYRGR